MSKTWLVVGGWVLVVGLSAMVVAADPAANSAELVAKANAELLRALKEESGDAKVHAGAAMVGQGHAAFVRPVFEQELKLHGEKPQVRIGIWRALADSAMTTVDGKAYKDKLLAVALTPNSPEAEAAFEALFLLGFAPTPEERAAIEKLLPTLAEKQAILARAIFVKAGKPEDVVALAASLKSESPEARRLTASCLRQLTSYLFPVQGALAEALAKEQDPAARLSLLCATYAARGNYGDGPKARTELLTYLKNATPEQKCELGTALSQQPKKADLPLLAELLTDKDPNVRISAAAAILIVAAVGQ